VHVRFRSGGSQRRGTDTNVSEAGIYPGWFVVAAAFVVLFVVYGIQFSFGTFVDAVSADTGWPEARIQLIFALYVFGYSALSAVSGTLTDRLGPRIVVGSGAVVLTAGYLIWAAAPNLWVVLIGLGMVAPIGMSASWVPCSATVVRWFVERRGTALAVTTAGGSLANIVVPPVAAAMIGWWGWRAALSAMAAVGGVAMLAAALRMHRGPDSLGLAVQSGDRRTTAAEERSMTVSEASQTTEFRLVLAMYAMSFVVVFLPFVHVNQFATTLGAGPVRAATAISAIGIGGLAGRLAAGPASDRFGRRRITTVAFGSEFVAFAGMTVATGMATLYPAAVLFGFSYGATVTLLPALVGDYFGPGHAGAIVGRVFGIAGSMAAVGPYAAQLLVDATGNYRVAFGLSAAVIAFALLLSLRLPDAHEATARTPVPATRGD